MEWVPSGMRRVWRIMIRMRLMEWSRKLILKTGWCISKWAICDFKKGRWMMSSDGDDRWRTSAASSQWAEQNSPHRDKTRTLYVYLFFSYPSSGSGTYVSIFVHFLKSRHWAFFDIFEPILILDTWLIFLFSTYFYICRLYHRRNFTFRSREEAIEARRL